MSSSKHDNNDDDLAFLAAMGAIGLTHKGRNDGYDVAADQAFSAAMDDSQSIPDALSDDASARVDRQSLGLSKAVVEVEAVNWSEADALFDAAMAGGPIPQPSTALPARPKGPAAGSRPQGNVDKLKRKLAKGGIAANARLDLHGKTKDKAYTELKRFLGAAKTNDHNMVQIVFGRGLHSKGDAVLRPAVLRWLTSEFHDIVQQVIPAPRNQGGEGACYVVVRKRR